MFTKDDLVESIESEGEYANVVISTDGRVIGKRWEDREICLLGNDTELLSSLVDA